MANRVSIFLLRLRAVLGFISAEQQFGTCLPVFQAEQVRMRSKRASELSAGRQRLGSTYGRTGQGDPIGGRYELYRVHADNLGNDFVVNFRTIIAAHCDHISPEAESDLLNEMNQMYSHAMQNAKRADSSYVQSIGRPNDLDAFYRPTEGIYTSSLSANRDVLQSEIKLCNLKASHTKLEARRQRIISLSFQVLSYVVTFTLGVLLGKWLAGK